MRTPADLPLYWRVVLTNGLVFVLGTLALAFSPATVSERVLPSEAVVLGIGVAVLSARRARTVATVFVGVYAGLALLLAIAMAVSGGSA